MAPLPVIADTFRVAANYDKLGQSAVNVMHFRTTTDNAQELGERIIDSWDGDQLATLSSDATLTSFDITPLDGVGATVTVNTPEDVIWSGSTGTESLPQVACIIKLTTALRGRSFRGRLYLPFTDESKQDDGNVAPSILGTVTTAWETFVADMLAGGAELVVASYKLEEANAVTSLLLEDKTATQRRRQARNRV
jgi:hypothetical protein